MEAATNVTGRHVVLAHHPIGDFDPPDEFIDIKLSPSDLPIRLKFPLHGPARRYDGASSASVTPSVETRLSKPLQCLLVEDQVRVVRFITQGLEEAGHTVTSARQGEEALDLTLSRTFSVVILDIGLAGQVDGFEVVRRLRARDDTTPVLMLTARHETEDIVRALDLGADDFMSKPFDFREFESRLRSLVRRTQTAESTTLRIGGVEIDPVRESALVDGTPLSLTPIEFRLLRTLAEESEQPVSRKTLHERVWGLAFDPGTRVIDVHISNLRKKIRGADSHVRITTERGIGFRLTAIASP